MIKAALVFMSELLKRYDIGGKILDVGSRQLNFLYTEGSTEENIRKSCMRQFFIDYTGLDMIAGENVDIVSNSHKIPFEDKTFDCVITVDMLEHDDNPFQTAKEMMRVLKKGGYAIVMAPFVHRIHEHPNDYFRYTPSGLKILFKDLKCLEEELADNQSRVILIKT